MNLLLILKLALIAAKGRLDRVRGDHFNPVPKAVALVLLGFISAVLLNHGADRLTLLITLAVALAYNGPGFGQPIGAIVNPPGNQNYEDWQFGWLRTNPTLALLFYGVFFPAALMCLYLVIIIVSWFIHADVAGWLALWPEVLSAGVKLMLAYGVAFADAPWMAVSLGVRLDKRWALQEELRGWIAGGLLFAEGLL